MFEIFGGQRGSTFVEGLADSTSDSDFDEKLAAFEITWNAREKALSSSPQFFTYFTRYKAPVFKESMIASVREKAGLGHPPKEYHNNGPECINNVIKMKVKRERSVLDEFCSKMKSLAEDQQNHLLRAITRRGEYRLHPYFKEYEMDSSQWFKLDENARTDHLHRLRSTAKKLESKRDDKTGAAVPPSLPEKSSCTEGEALTSIDWPLYAKLPKCTAVPESTLNGILRRAEELVATTNTITTAPVDGTARMVKSKSNPSRPHLVQVFQDGKVTCDENCPMWTSLKICSHCVAVVHCLNVTGELVNWFTINSKQPNLTKITTGHIGRNIGKKPSQNRYSQRKTKPPVLARTMNPGFSSAPDVMTTSSAIQSSSTMAVPVSTGMSNSCQHSFPFGPGPNPWWGMYSYPPWTTDTPFSSQYYDNHNTLSGYNSFSACSSPSVCVNYNSPSSYNLLHSPSPHSIFWVFRLNKRITTCYGCRNKFTRAADGGLPIPPLDLVLKCNEGRQYYDKAGVLQEKENSNTYYHPHFNCIKQKHPDFQCSDIRLDDSVRSTLHSSHFELLQSVFGFSF